MENNGWDAEGNSDNELLLNNGSSIHFVDHSDFYNNFVMDTTITSSPLMYFNNTPIAQETDRTTNNGITYTIPVTFTFSDSSWKYVFAFIFSMLFAPVFIIWSKIKKRPTGIRVYN